MQASVKPGTRCECQECAWNDGVPYPTSHVCTRDAVRMVTVREACDYCAVPVDKKRGFETGDCDGCTNGITEVVYVMCAACASYHETRQEERA